MTIPITAINTMNGERTNYQSISHAKNHCVELSRMTGYTIILIDTNTKKLVGKIRPNHRLYKGKYTARFIRNE